MDLHMHEAQATTTLVVLRMFEIEYGWWFFCLFGILMISSTLFVLVPKRDSHHSILYAMELCPGTICYGTLFIVAYICYGTMMSYYGSVL